MFGDLPEWTAYANCVGLPDTVFFPPEDGDVEDQAWYAGPLCHEALVICQRCEVRTECFDYALSDPYTVENGVYGGTTPQIRTGFLEALSVRRGHDPSGDASPHQG